MTDFEEIFKKQNEQFMRDETKIDFAELEKGVAREQAERDERFRQENERWQAAIRAKQEEFDKVFEKTILADKASEAAMNAEIKELTDEVDRRTKLIKQRYQATCGLKPWNSTMDEAFSQLAKATMENKG